MKTIEHFSLMISVVMDLIRPNRKFCPVTFSPVRDFSVIIPTLNEERYIRDAVNSLRGEMGILEIIVADGGSTDRTGEIANELGARFIGGEKGRGNQVYRGVEACRGDIVLILHADCRIKPGLTGRILHLLKKDPHMIGGSAGMRYQGRSIQNRFVALLNNGRSRFLGISFGDQCQFFRREALPHLGGYPAQMLMEDVELSMRMRENGPVAFIPEGVVVSNRRWEREGFMGNFQKVITLCFRYLMERRLGFADTRQGEYYRRYYG